MFVDANNNEKEEEVIKYELHYDKLDDSLPIAPLIGSLKLQITDVCPTSAPTFLLFLLSFSILFSFFVFNRIILSFPKRRKCLCSSVSMKRQKSTNLLGECNYSFFASLFCFVLFCFVLFCFVLFCFVLFCFVLFCFVLFCFVLFCFVFYSNNR